MNIEAVTGWLDQMLRRREGLREIDPELPVPWTPAQWLLAVVITVVAVLLIRRFYRWILLRIRSRRRDFQTLTQELDDIDEARLQRQLPYHQAVAAAAELLREGMRLADSESGGNGLYRTSNEWLRWSDRMVGDEKTRQRIESVLRRHDRSLYVDGAASLDDARLAVAESRSVLTELSRAASSQPVAKPPLTTASGLPEESAVQESVA